MRKQPQAPVMNAGELLQRAAAAMLLPALAGFWQDLVSSLGGALNTDWALVGQLPSEQNCIVQTLAVWHGGKIVPNFDFHLERIPEDDMLSCDICLFPSAAQKCLPHPWLQQIGAEAFARASLFDSLGRLRGILAVAHSQPLKHGNLVEAVLRIFAFRATTELDRGVADEALIRELQKTVQIMI